MRNVFISVLLAASSFLAAQQPGIQPDENPSAEAEIRALEVKLADLIVRADWDEYASYLAPDYQHTRDNGHVEGKGEALANLRDAKHKIIVMEIEPADATIRIYGDSHRQCGIHHFSTRIRTSQEPPHPPNQRVPETRWQMVFASGAGNNHREVVPEILFTWSARNSGSAR